MGEDSSVNRPSAGDVGGNEMKRISFAWTSEAFEDGTKTVTRRDWKESYARWFHAGDEFLAVDKLRSKNARVLGIGRITRDPYLQQLNFMSDDHFEREGGTRYWVSKDAFIKAMGGRWEFRWVVEFERVGGSR